MAGVLPFTRKGVGFYTFLARGVLDFTRRGVAFYTLQQATICNYWGFWPLGIG
jgi:hypothetical protein